MILLDASGVVAALGSNEPHHEQCARTLQAAGAPRIISPFVLAEADYLVLRYGGVSAEIALLEEVSRGVYELASFSASDVDEARRIVATYRSLRIGLADASIVVLANRYGIFDVLTLDERHFRAIKPAPRKHFRILPADA